MSERSAVRYRARGIVMAGKGPGMAQRDRTFPPQPREDLVFRGGRTLPQMSYKTFYVGSGWADGAPASSRANLDAALAAAMTDPALDEIVGQFFGGSNITTLPLQSTVLDLPLQQVFDKGDIHCWRNGRLCPGFSRRSISKPVSSTSSFRRGRSCRARAAATPTCGSAAGPLRGHPISRKRIRAMVSGATTGQSTSCTRDADHRLLFGRGMVRGRQRHCDPGLGAMGERLRDTLP